MILKLKPQNDADFFGSMNFTVYGADSIMGKYDSVDTTHLTLKSFVNSREEKTYCSSVAHERSITSKCVLCDDRVIDSLRQHPDVIRQLLLKIPERESLCLCFDGTVFRCAEGFLYTRCIHAYKRHFTYSYIVLNTKNIDINFVSVIYNPETS